MSELKLQFDDKQQYQLDAIASTVELFTGGVIPSQQDLLDAASDSDIYANPKQFSKEHPELALNKEKLYKNMQAIMARNSIKLAGRDKNQNEISINHEDIDDFTFNFSIEMETGTGKTYTYLRTILELYKQYGLKKFIIAVPSIAIKEGILKTSKITKDHFKILYPDVNFELTEYNSNNLNTVREFAFNDELQIMLITTGAFSKSKNNNIYKVAEGLGDMKPIDLLSGTNPIFILDEPQNMEAANTKDMLERFTPCFTLRYSATHKEPYNLIYQLTPAEAYRQHLVKGIEVFSITEENDISDDKIKVVSVSYSSGSKTPEASVSVLQKQKNGEVKEKTIKLKHGQDLEEETGLSQYEGFIVTEIFISQDKSVQYVSFANGKKVHVGAGNRSDIDQFMKLQIKQTIKEHLDKKLELNPKGIKVLSLFFIDKVANYVKLDDAEPKIKNWFEEYLTEFMTKPEWSRYHGIYNLTDIAKIHDGYFSGKKGEVAKDLDKNASKDGYSDKEAFDLIMKDKERLLSLDEPLEFIFSHSALREGWDNPNVFNICTLNETNSIVKKRQEIGRGVRLPVYQDGTRCTDSNINKLTVIVNESYKDFVIGLQKELDDAGFASGETQTPSDARARISIVPDAKVLASKEFNILWDKIKKQIKPQYNFDETELISLISKTLLSISKDDVKATRLEGTRTEVLVDESGIKTGETDSELMERIVGDKFSNLIELLSSETNITKATILKAIELKNADDIIRIYKNNPAKFIEVASMRIRDDVAAYGTTVLSYIKIDKPDLDKNDYFKTINAYKDKSTASTKSVYGYTIYDSGTEETMVKALERNASVKFYVKFPDGYRIPTPNGNYNPDWGVVIEKDGELKPFILETKNTLTGDWIDRTALSKDENIKIDAAKVAYEKLLGIPYVVGRSLKDTLMRLKIEELS